MEAPRRRESKPGTARARDPDGEAGKEASVITNLVVYRMLLDDGATSRFAVGKYFDTVGLEDEAPLLMSLNVRLDTREL